MIDLFGLEQPTPRKNDRREAAALVEVLKALVTHPAVAPCSPTTPAAVAPAAVLPSDASPAHWCPLQNVGTSGHEYQTRARMNGLADFSLSTVDSDLRDVLRTGAAMTCQTCTYRLDVTLWGCWLATGCRKGLVIRCQCDEHHGSPTGRL